MPFITICPYCRAGGIRVPDHAVGAVATCPKCQSCFTVAPTEDLPHWARGGAAGPTPHADPSPSPPAVTPPLKHPPHDPTPERIEPVSVLAPPPPGGFAASPALTPGEAGLPLAAGLVAAVLFVSAVLVAEFGQRRILAGVLGVAGVCVGVSGALSRSSDTRSRATGAVAAVANVAAVAAVVVAPGWVGLRPSLPPRTVAPVGPRAVPHDGGPPVPAEWVDASQAGWEYRGIRVVVEKASLGPVEAARFAGPKGGSRDHRLVVWIRVGNLGPEEFEFRGWTASPDLRLTDEAGQPVPVREVTAPTGARLALRADASQTVVIDPPPRRGGALRLELSGGVVSSPEPVRLVIPWAFVTTQSPARKPSTP